MPTKGFLKNKDIDTVDVSAATSSNEQIATWTTNRNLKLINISGHSTFNSKQCEYKACIK